MNTGTSRLVLTIEPVTGESLPGYIVRLAHRARFPSADVVAARAGLRQPGLTFLYASLSGLAALTGVPAERLEAIAYRPTPRAGHHAFLGGVLQREFIDLMRRRTCPDCLAAVPYHRAVWDLALATCCTVHGVRLITACPACERSLGWNWPDLTRCRCGAQLASRTPKPVTAAERMSQAALLAIASGEEPPTMPAELVAADRADLVRLVMCLGMFLTGWKSERRVETLAAAGPEATARVVDAGIQCLRDWPGSLLDFFAREQEHAPSRHGRYGARKTLGPFYDWLNMQERGPIRSALAETVSGFFTADPVLARLAHRSTLVADVSSSERPLTIVEAGRRIGVRGRQVRRLVEAGLISGHVSDGPGSLGLLDGRTVERMADLASGAMDLEATARELSISKVRVRRLAEAAVITPIHAGNAAGWGSWMFDRAAIEELLCKLASDVVSQDHGIIGFETAVEVLRRKGFSFPDALRAMLNGELAVAGFNPRATGLKALRFRDADVRALAFECKDSTKALTIQEAARELGLKWQVVAHLVARGFIVAAEKGIPPAAITDFRATFVSGAELARARKTSPRSLAAVLRRQGIRPVVGPDADRSRQNFFRRDDLGLLERTA